MSPLRTQTIRKSKNISEIVVFDTRDPNNKQVTYKINKRTRQIKFYPKPHGYPVYFQEITINGFNTLPDEFNKKGYIKSGVFYYLNKKLNEKHFREITISKTDENYYRRNKININYQSLKILKDKLSAINYESSIDKDGMVNEFLHEVLPRKFEKPIIKTTQKVAKVINNLDEKIIKYLGPRDIQILINFFEALIKKKYKSAVYKRKLFSSAKIKVDDIAIKQIIDEFENMLKEGSSESEWGEYLQKNLFLIDSKYIKVIPELNVILASYRKVDFGLIDSQGYIDIFEIKKPTMKLLAKNKDRGNYYWRNEDVNAIVKAEKSIFNAQRKAPVLKEDIKREKNLDVEVIKPRAIVIMGSIKQLDNNQKKNDFRVLRMSLKNLEIVLYDELLERIKAQKNKVYID